MITSRAFGGLPAPPSATLVVYRVKKAHPLGLAHELVEPPRAVSLQLPVGLGHVRARHVARKARARVLELQRTAAAAAPLVAQPLGHCKAAAPLRAEAPSQGVEDGGAVADILVADGASSTLVLAALSKDGRCVRRGMHRAPQHHIAVLANLKHGAPTPVPLNPRVAQARGAGRV
eukprot:CAMPEP_0173384120 /NCGR_PEP_ID=MMETSP1356-20130122/6689_1 /TAXON_ID=77927 ORGANISM="Hemiselmis virescens, Strain PCC157" /NCGR_SAMPLE_ID=MMETSP1356 /ASSEMBLY_ACC=CAM_ASM_000847 /LENGTH=174 /DNA_ID=CAMNT_0014339313 /DNA_START=487 /DNA_END=1011 /DNA_ORIENTATION=+